MGAASSLIVDLERGVQTRSSTSTTRGATSSLADSEMGMRNHDEVVCLHEPPQVVLEALLGNSLKSGIGDLRQQVRECEE